MIVKKIKNTKTEKPKVWQIGDLVDYIRFPHNKSRRKKSNMRAGETFCPPRMWGKKWK